MQKLRLGVIGTGRIGRLHVETLCHHVENTSVEAVSDIFLKSAHEVAEKHGISKVFSDYTQLLNDPTIDAVLICSPTDTHAPIIQQAAAAKKHIFCEKPIALSIEKINECIRVVKDHAVLLQVGLNRRFDPNFARIKEGITKGEIGAPQLLKITSRDPSPPPVEYIKTSGGLFLDMAIHDYDMARFLLNEEVDEVYAMGANLISPSIKDAGDMDTALSVLRFKSGAICSIDNSRQALYGYDQRVEAFGEKGTLICSNTSPNNVELWNRGGQTKPPPHFFFLERYTQSYINELNEFVQALRENRTPSVGGDDGLMSVVIALAARKSATENRPVKISEIF